MTSATSQFTGSIPEFYDRGLGPFVFAGFSADLARRASTLQTGRVLELAAGTGILTRGLRDTLPPAVQIVATDLNPPMLAVAKTKFEAEESVSFEPADACALPFADQSFDLMVCQFGVMFFPDKDVSFCEAMRVLKPGGRYLFNVWDAFVHNPFARIAHETIGSFFEADPPVFYKTPFGYSEIAPVTAALAGAGFTAITAETVSLQSEIADARQFADGLVFGNPIVEEIRRQSTVRPEDVVAAVARALRKEFGPDPGRMPLRAIVYEATKPSAA
jgi:ubiquinone/menaquinone biosynthesis C-methylase UbiE